MKDVIAIRKRVNDKPIDSMGKWRIRFGGGFGVWRVVDDWLFVDGFGDLSFSSKITDDSLIALEFDSPTSPNEEEELDSTILLLLIKSITPTPNTIIPMNEKLKLL